MDLHAEMGALGVLGIGLRAEYGGSADEDPVALGIACEEIGAADVNLAAAPVTIGLTGAQLAKGATPAVAQRRLPAMISGEGVVAFGHTEPKAGSDTACLWTVATLATAAGVLDGEKTRSATSPQPALRWSTPGSPAASGPRVSEAWLGPQRV